MANPQDTIRRVIDETVGPRCEAQRSVFAVSSTDPIPVSRTDLLYVWDEHHNEMLDFAGGLAPLGHRHTPIHAVVSEHMRYYGYTAPQGQHVLRWPVSYAEALSAAFSGPEDTRKVLFCEGERDAVRMAVRLAGGGKPVVVVDTGCHDWLTQEPGHELFDPGDWNSVYWGQYGGLLLSVVDSRARPTPGAREWMLSARTANVPVIIDESVTGFGRTGSLWGQENVGLIADLTVLGGPVGGGLPLGAVIGPARFFDVPIPVSSHAGHPWACAAGQVTLAAIHPGVLEHVTESSRALDKALTELAGQFPRRIAGHHGLGLFKGLRFIDPDRAQMFPLAARSHGLHLAPAVDDTVLLSPILVSSTHEVTRGVDLMADVLMSWEDG
jgi:4-aminobutyrate aminotransferase-like enzyme